MRRRVMKIDFLKKHPEHIKTVVKWVFDEWWATRYSFDEVEKLYKTHLNDDELPIALIAFKDGIPAGTVLLCEYDPDIELKVAPWLQGLYVKEAYRKAGIGKALFGRVESIAREMGYKKVYLSTHVKHYYEKLGCTKVMTLENGDTVFEKEIS